MNKFLNYLFITAFALSAVFTSCKKDDDKNGNGNGNGNDGGITELNVKAENGSAYNSQVNVVKLLIDMSFSEDGGKITNLRGVPLTNDNFSDGGFSVKMPETVSNQHLRKLSETFSGSNISDNDAKGVWNGKFVGYDSSDDYVGGFYCEVAGKENIRFFLFYVDRDVTITGSSAESTFDCTLKKGWNWLYMINNLFTTKEQGTMKWYFSTGSDWAIIK